MFKNSFFKLNTKRKFNNRPRYLKEKEEQLNYSFNSRIKNSRENFTSNDRNSIWNQERITKRTKKNYSFNKLFIIIDFDFSIFINY